MRLCLALVSALAVSSADAQVFEMCDGTPINANVQAEMSEFGRTFANGAVTVFVHYVDTYLPNGTLIGVLHPVRGDLAGSGTFPGCTTIYSFRDEVGYFNAVLLDRAEAEYDPAVGLTIDLPVRHYVGMGAFEDDVLTLIINQTTGTISTP